MRFSGFVGRSGDLRIHREDRWVEWLKPRKGQPVEVELRDEAAIRSNRQNRFLNGPVVDEFARVWHADGYRYVLDRQPQTLPRRVVRSWMLDRFCPHDCIEGPGGEDRYVRQSTADLTVAEFSVMLDDMNEYLVHKDGERGIFPDPEEWWKSHV